MHEQFGPGEWGLGWAGLLGGASRAGNVGSGSAPSDGPTRMGLERNMTGTDPGLCSRGVSSPARAPGFPSLAAAPARARLCLDFDPVVVLGFKCRFVRLKAGLKLCYWAKFQVKFCSGRVSRAAGRRPARYTRTGRDRSKTDAESARTGPNARPGLAFHGRDGGVRTGHA